MLVSINELARRGDLSGVQALLESGTAVDFIDNGRFNETALQIAGRAGFLDLVELLLAAGADVNHKDHDGFSPVTSAARARNWAVVKRLAECGADFQVYDGYGQCGTDYLSRCRRQKMRQEIEDILAKRAAG